MLVAIAPTKFAKAVVSLEDNRPRPYVVTHLSRALEDVHRTDAHLVTYVMRDAGGALAAVQPRIAKGASAQVLARLEVDVLFADLDNPDHCDWTPELRALALADEVRLTTCGIYYTPHGRRLVQPLTRPIPIAMAEPIIAGWLRHLEDLGFHPDWSCRDWTRHFRLPHATIGGRAIDLPVRLERMVPIDPPEPGAPRRARARERADRTPLGSIDDAPLAKAFAAAGWLGHRLGIDKMAAICPWRSSHSIGRDYDTSTVLFAASASSPLGRWWCSHEHCQSRSRQDVIDALPQAARALLPRDAPPPPVATSDRPTARATLERAFRRPTDGLSVVVANCGAGKTEAAIEVAAERAAAHTGKRALGTRTSISLPTTRLAREVADRLRARGTKVLRLFGPLSHEQPDGTKTCVYHAHAAALAQGGVSIPWQLCEGRGRERCDHYETCEARSGCEGDEDARIVLGPHQMLSQLDAAAGSTGLLVVDEPPPLLRHEVITSAQVRESMVTLERAFSWRYAVAMAVCLEAIARWIDVGALDEATPLERACVALDPSLLERAFESTGETDAQAIARAAFEPAPDGIRPNTAPPIAPAYLHSALRSLSMARQIGQASRVARIVWTGLTAEPGTVLGRLEERDGQRVLVVTTPDVALFAAMRREGSIVMADASGRLHLPIYERVMGYAPAIAEVRVGDGATVERLVLRTRATRSGWMPHGRLQVGPALVRAVRMLVDWLRDGPDGELAAVVTMEPIKLALQAALGDEVAPKGALTASAIADAQRLLGPEMRRLARRPDLGHYGSLRGLDHWRWHGALATVGDPWPQLGDARYEAQYLRVERWEERLEGLVAAELAQAHGRLRTVHRTTPARALHVGSVVPDGWSGVRVRDDAGGRRAVRHTAEQIREAIERAGTIAAAARALGISRMTVRAAAQKPP